MTSFIDYAIINICTQREKVLRYCLLHPCRVTHFRVLQKERTMAFQTEKVAMFRNYLPAATIVSFFTIGLASIYLLWYVDTHPTYYLDDDIAVHVSGRMNYIPKFETSSDTNQFSVCRDVPGGGGTSSPAFVVENIGSKPRTVSIESMVEFERRPSETVELKPGERHPFEFTVPAKTVRWYCWINPVRVLVMDFTKLSPKE